MGKLSSILCAFLLLVSFKTVVFATETDKQEHTEQRESVITESPSVYLMELHTGKTVYEKNSKEIRSPASITKIMTLLLIYEELEKGNLTLSEEVTVSAHAKSMGGSQVYLEEGEKQTVETMIKCIVVASGNDASVAMAEHIQGNEESFVKRMNEKAMALGMKNTNFEDCCGLTDSANHYTTAEDVAIMSRELVTKYPDILKYSSIWMDTITHTTQKGSEEFGLSNTNKLLRTYPGCVGLKTGSTSVAKFCVSAVAKQENVTMLAVVMGSDTPAIRSKDATALLNYGFSSCALYIDEHEELVFKTKISGGNQKFVKGDTVEPFYYASTEKQEINQIDKVITYQEDLRAPVKKGEVIGKITYMLAEKEIGSIDIISIEHVEKATFWQILKQALQLWGV